MSTIVVGFIPPDEKWEKMKEAWDACRCAGVEAPAEVQKFFDYEHPENKPGREVKISEAVTSYEEHSRLGFDVEIAKLPKNVTVVRFYNSW